MQQPQDLCLGMALEVAKGTSLKDRDDVKSISSRGCIWGFHMPLGAMPRHMDVLRPGEGEIADGSCTSGQFRLSVGQQKLCRKGVDCSKP